MGHFECRYGWMIVSLMNLIFANVCGLVTLIFLSVCRYFYTMHNCVSTKFVYYKISLNEIKFLYCRIIIQFS